MNENGSILVDDYATFRVQMDNRGANPWDDVINLDSKHGRKDQPLFQANKGSIVDVRDDNTDYYAELISVPLGASTNVVFQFNNPLYVSFMRYTNSEDARLERLQVSFHLELPKETIQNKLVMVTFFIFPMVQENLVTILNLMDQLVLV